MLSEIKIKKDHLLSDSLCVKFWEITTALQLQKGDKQLQRVIVSQIYSKGAGGNFLA